jgi:hypothetical protein
MIKLDYGCGKRKENGWFGVDIRKYPGVDHVMNIGKHKLPLEDDSVDEIKCMHVLEHLYPEELFHAMDEAYRVIKPTGSFTIEVPKAGTPAYYINPDHKIQFVQDTFGFFQVPFEGKDPHGYMKGFWHVQINKIENDQVINVTLYPNKEGGRYPYVKII